MQEITYQATTANNKTWIGALIYASHMDYLCISDANGDRLTAVASNNKVIVEHSTRFNCKAYYVFTSGLLLNDQILTSCCSKLSPLQTIFEHKGNDVYSAICKKLHIKQQIPIIRQGLEH